MLYYKIVNDGVVFPRRACCHVRSAEGIIEPLSLLYRGSTESYYRACIFDTEQKVDLWDNACDFDTDERYVIFGGGVFGPFGHFVIESLSRLWCANRFLETPVAFVGTEGELRPFQRDIISLLRIENYFVVTRPTKFARVILPSPGFVLPFYFDIGHASFLSRYENRFDREDRKVWLSRSHLSQATRVYEGEDVLEDMLLSRGWTVFHPQEHSICEQLEVISSSRTIAGLRGSAFHALVFLDSIGADVRIFSEGKVSLAFETIKRVRRLKQTEHRVPMQVNADCARPLRYILKENDCKAIMNLLEAS